MSKVSVMLDADAISKRITEIAAEITADFQGKEFVALCVLSGSFVFAADLLRHIDNDRAQVAFIRAKSYLGTQSTGNVQISGYDGGFERKNILIIEDIVDTGRTLRALRDEVLSRNPESLKIAVLLDKPDRRITDIKADYTCFEIEDKFVVGYGLDWNEKYRTLPYIGCVE